MNKRNEALIRAILNYLEDKTEVTTIPNIPGYQRKMIRAGIKYCIKHKYIIGLTLEGDILLRITDLGIDLLYE